MKSCSACGLRLLLVAVTLTPVVFAASPWPQPVGRDTNDRSADLLDALVRTGRFDDAIGICDSQLRGADPQSDDAALWTIRQSQILAARQLGIDHFDDSDVDAAREPVSALLDAYPQHRRRMFLEAQNAAVEREAAVHSVTRAAVSPTSDTARELALTRLLRTTTRFESLAVRVGDARTKLDNQGGTRDFALVDDLSRLQQELQVDAVSLALMQTELFPAGSVDRIAAATKAEQAAEEAIGKLPSDTAARREVERLKVEAILRADQLGRAETLLVELTRAIGAPIPPRLQAMQVRLDIASRRMAEAGARLAAYYGDSPENAPPSIEMDLARLEFLLRSGGSVGAWLAEMENRGGAYARRRAEAVSLASLGSSPSNADSSMVDPSLVAAQGQDWLRRGDPSRAGDLLSAAAAAESDPDRAIERASEAAAALVSAGRVQNAAEVLADIALAKSTGTNAAAAHLQAMVLVSSKRDADAIALERMLRANLQRWPSGETAVAARKWLVKLLLGQQRFIDAAEVATSLPVDEMTAEDARAAMNLWRAAFRQLSDDESVAEMSSRFRESFRPLLKNESVGPLYRLGAALLLDRDALIALPEQGSDDEVGEFTDALLVFRQQGVISDPLQSPPDDYIDDATWRLMRDGRAQPPMRKPIAELVQTWEGNSIRSVEQAERLLWMDNAERAVAMLRELIQESPKSVEVTRHAANLLGSSAHADVRNEAIRLWDRLAAGTEQGGPLWHEAKLAAIELLRKAGKREEATRRAKYILLTVPAMNEEFVRQYQAASQ